MKRTVLTLSMILWMFSTTIAQTLQPLGKLRPFWRNHPVLGPFLQQGLWLDKVPGYFLDTDFPYKKRPFDKEVLFADHLSVVRLLGGVDKYPGVELELGSAGVNDDGTMKKSKLGPLTRRPLGSFRNLILFSGTRTEHLGLGLS